MACLGLASTVYAGPSSPPAGNYITNVSTIAAKPAFNVSSGTIRDQFRLTYISTGSVLRVDSNGIVTSTTIPTSGGGGGGSSSLETMVNGVRVSSPTASINVIAGYGIGVSGAVPATSTAAITFNLLSNATAYIQNSSSLQSGATFYVSSGTVAGLLSVQGRSLFLGDSSFNMGVGNQAFKFFSSGIDNTAFGYQSMLGVNTGSDNTAIGYGTLSVNTSGVQNTAIGSLAMQSNATSSENTAIGAQAMRQTGQGSGSAKHSTAIGAYSLFNAGTSNTSIDDNTGIGFMSLYNDFSGIDNTAVGSLSLSSATLGSNTAIGYGSGYNSGVTLDTISNCTFVGFNANASNNALINSMALGSGAQVTASSQVVVGNVNVNQIVMNGAVNAMSSMTVIGSNGLNVTYGITGGSLTASNLTSGQCVQTGTGGLLTVTGTACGSGGGGGGAGTVNAASQFSVPYYNLGGSSTSLAAYSGVTFSTNTGVFLSTKTTLGDVGFAVSIASNAIMPGTTFYGPAGTTALANFDGKLNAGMASAAGSQLHYIPGTGLGIGKVPTQSVDTANSIQAADHMVAPYYSNPSVLQAPLVINASGANWGAIQNDGGISWNLGYAGSPPTAGTAVLRWDSTPAVNILSSMTVTGSNGLNATYNISGGSLTARNVTSSLLATDSTGLIISTSITNINQGSLGVSWDGGGSALTTGTTYWLVVPSSGTIKKMVLTALPSGSMSVIVSSSSVFNTSPVNICAAACPNLSANTIVTDGTLTGWSTAVAKDAFLYFVSTAATTVTQAVLTLEYQKTTP